MEYASNGKGNLGVTLGAIGTGLGVLNGGLGGLFGGWGNGCSENTPVSRYELNRETKLAAKDSEIALLKANTYNDQKMLEVYAYIDGQLKEVRNGLAAQASTGRRSRRRRRRGASAWMRRRWARRRGTRR